MQRSFTIHLEFQQQPLLLTSIYSTTPNALVKTVLPRPFFTLVLKFEDPIGKQRNFGARRPNYLSPNHCR